jgi:hypothetical protein
MTLARTPPTDAISNLSKWAEWIGIRKIPDWLRSRSIDKSISVVLANNDGPYLSWIGRRELFDILAEYGAAQKNGIASYRARSFNY